MMNRRRFLEDQATLVGLKVYTWSPGDGVTRYRFSLSPYGYEADSGLFTALGLAEAFVWLKGYRSGRVSNA